MAMARARDLAVLQPVSNGQWLVVRRILVNVLVVLGRHVRRYLHRAREPGQSPRRWI